MKASHSIRLALLVDQRELLRLIKAYYRFDKIRVDETKLPGALRALLRKPELGRVWVLDLGNRLAAYLVLTFNYDLEFGGTQGMITELYVERQHREFGIGRALIEEARAFCRKTAISTVELQVSKNNRAARAFYKSIGFRKLDRLVMTIDADGRSGAKEEQP